MSSSQHTLAQNLRRLRGARSGRTLAEQTGLAVSSLLSYERVGPDSRWPGPEVLDLLAGHHGVTVAQLFAAGDELNQTAIRAALNGPLTETTRAIRRIADELGINLEKDTTCKSV